jgi:two-component system C4-dicarboxylate transport response regulator DctD
VSVAVFGHVSLLDSYQAELGVLYAHPHNVLLEGPAAATEVALLLLQPHLRDPLVGHPLHSPFEHPEGTTGSLILRDVAALAASDQARLLVWLQGAGLGVQVVSTTEQPLFALVAQGLFDAALYYRLNVLLLRVGPTSSSGRQERFLPRARGPEGLLAAVTHGQ